MKVVVFGVKCSLAKLLIDLDSDTHSILSLTSHLSEVTLQVVLQCILADCAISLRFIIQCRNVFLIVKRIYCNCRVEKLPT